MVSALYFRQNGTLGPNKYSLFLTSWTQLLKRCSDLFENMLVIMICRWIAEEDTIINFPTVHMKNKLPIWIKRI